MIRSLRTTLLAAALTLVAVSPAAGQASQPDGEYARYRDKLPDADRVLLEASVGYAPPAFTDDIEWLGDAPGSWKDMHGKVVVIQSFTNRVASTWGRAARLHKSVRDADDVVVVALHPPTDLDTIERWSSRQKLAFPVAVDHSGAFCDELGIYKRPVNVIIDRNGVVRFAGLNTNGALKAINALRDEKVDESITAEPRPGAAVSETETSEAAAYPPMTGGVGSAMDVRGRRAPEFHVDQWITKQPDARNKVVIIDFWATWCGPCIRSIPHMNDLADRFRDTVCVVGISSEEFDKFDSGMGKLRRSQNITIDTFRYSIALDPKRTMQSAVQVRGIPHVLVMSRDWVVRWQGHPSSLTADVMQQIVDADFGGASDGGGGTSRYRWTGGEGNG